MQVKIEWKPLKITRLIYGFTILKNINFREWKIKILPKHVCIRWLSQEFKESTELKFGNQDKVWEYF